MIRGAVPSPSLSASPLFDPRNRGPTCRPARRRTARPPSVRAAPGRLSAISVFLCKSVLYGASVWVRRALNSRKRRFPARAVFILTSIVAPLVQLSYVRMVVMTLPYTVALTVAGLVGVLTMNYHE